MDRDRHIPCAKAEGAVNYYNRHLGDYAKDTGHLSLVEHGLDELIVRKLGNRQFYDFLRRFGYGESTHSGFPGEVAGLFLPGHWALYKRHLTGAFLR